MIAISPFQERTISFTPNEIIIDAEKHHEIEFRTSEINLQFKEYEYDDEEVKIELNNIDLVIYDKSDSIIPSSKFIISIGFIDENGVKINIPVFHKYFETQPYKYNTKDKDKIPSLSLKCKNNVYKRKDVENYIKLLEEAENISVTVYIKIRD